jgi:hypothetical protein
MRHGGSRPKDVPLADRRRAHLRFVRSLLAPDLRLGVGCAGAGGLLRHLLPVRLLVLVAGPPRAHRWWEAGCAFRTLPELREGGGPALEAIVRVVLGEEKADRSYPLMRLLALDALRLLRNPDQKKQILLDVIEEHRVLPVMAHLLKELGKEHG